MKNRLLTKIALKLILTERKQPVKEFIFKTLYKKEK